MSPLTEPTRLTLAKGQPVPNDPYFAFNSLLLHGDGVNGSTTITDSSGSPKTVTAVGNAQISTAQSKFGGASIAFDGTGDYLTVPNNADFDFGAGDFTIEFWLYTNSIVGAATLVAKRATLSVYAPFTLSRDGANIVLYMSSNNSTWNVASNQLFGSVSTDQWYFCALSRSGSSIRGFLNGSLSFTVTSTAALMTSTSALLVGGLTDGAHMNGHINDLRITKGVARYTSNFTPPTAPFPDF